MERVIDYSTGEIVNDEDVFSLEILSAAQQAIAAAQTIPDAKLLLDQFTAMAGLAKRQKVELGIQQEIASSRLWTRRVLGAMIEAMPKNKGTAGTLNGRDSSGGSRLEPPEDKTPTLADVGISKTESSRLQAEAEIPEPTIHEYIEKAKETENEITAAGLRRKAKELVSDKVTYDGDEWHTPPEYVEAARQVMGEIELDPATNETAQAQIKANCYFTKDDNGLERAWAGNVWMNPPYSYPKVERFIDKLISEFNQGNVPEAIVLVNNSSDTKWFHKLIDRFPACFTRGRVQFWHPDHKSFATRQGQTFFYLGPDWKAEVFKEAFSKFGTVVRAL